MTSTAWRPAMSTSSWLACPRTTAARADQGAAGPVSPHPRRYFSGGDPGRQRSPVRAGSLQRAGYPARPQATPQHLQAQAEGAIAEAYGLALPYRVLLTFDSEAAMRAVIGRVRVDRRFAESEPYFAFNTLDRVKQEFARGWFYSSGREGAIF